MSKPSPAPLREDVARVICASVSRVEGSPVNELLAVRNRYGQPEGEPRARAAWLYSSGWFVLWLEGQPEWVEDTLAKAAADPRNTGQRLLHRSTGPRTLTEPMSVVATQSCLTPTDFGRGVEWLRRSPFALDEPLAIWRRLAEPCSLPDAQLWADPPDADSACVASDRHGALDPLRKLAERNASRVVYQRFADSRARTSDVGAAYVDIPQAIGGYARVRVLSKRALDQPMLRSVLDESACKVRSWDHDCTLLAEVAASSTY